MIDAPPHAHPPLLLPPAARVRHALGARLLGGAYVIAGGLVAALVKPFDWPLGGWLAAYLVLVCGVAQYLMGLSVAYVERAPSGRRLSARLVAWNLGNGVVIAGTLAHLPYLVDLGGLILFATLIDLFAGALTGHGAPSEQDSGSTRSLHSALRAGYLALLVLLIVSIPIGLVLSHLRA